MPFVTLEHVELSLTYMRENTHSALMAILAMLRHGVPLDDTAEAAVAFGSPVELALLEDYFRPEGAVGKRPYFMPFGKGGGQPGWRDAKYPGRTLQRQRKERPEVFHQHDTRHWTLAPNLAAVLQENPAHLIGHIPIEAAYLATWCYRQREIPSLEEAADGFATEFRLNDSDLVGPIFSMEVPAELAAIPLADAPIDPAELLALLYEIHPAEEALEEGDAAAPALAGLGEPGDWGACASQLCGLVGLEEPAARARAALAAGMHVIFTGPPGTGKTQLAECLCKNGGFAAWTVPATDQWTTFETIGGYFPMPQEDEDTDRLDFLPGAVVHAIESGQCLIIDEINRADIDKAFGELFTLLSGNAVTLPYRRRNGGRFRRVRLEVDPGAVGNDETDLIHVPGWWRIIGSMNDADKASLKRLSMAFVRRFAFIPIDLPAPGIYSQLIQDAGTNAEGDGDMAALVEALIPLFTRGDEGWGRIGLPFGPSFPLSIIRYAESEWQFDPERTLESVLTAALELYVMPQLQGREDLHLEAVELLQDVLPNSIDDFSRHLCVWTGYAYR